MKVPIPVIGSIDFINVMPARQSWRSIIRYAQKSKCLTLAGWSSLELSVCSATKEKKEKGNRNNAVNIVKDEV